MFSSGARRLPGRAAALGAVLALAACGDLPQPFRGAPGSTAQRLAQPPPGRLAVERPGNALLTEQGSSIYAVFLAHDLQEHEMPAIGPDDPRPHTRDWRLVTTAAEKGGQVTPSFQVLDPSGADKGRIDGGPVPAKSWAAADPAVLEASAAEAAPHIIDLMNSIQAAQLQSDPNSLYNRPARVYVPDVVGAPGDGNQSLTVQMRRALATLGEVVQDTPANADFTIAGHVAAVPIAGGNLRVEIRWLMTDAATHDLGMVLQLNEVPPSSVTGIWGDVAAAVAHEAAGGVRDTIARNSGHAAKPAAAASAADAAPAATPATTPAVATP